MFGTRFFKLAIVTLAYVGILVPNASTFAGEPVQTAPKSKLTVNRISDVALQPGGAFTGRIIDSQGHPVHGAIVALNHAGREIVRTESRMDGSYTINGVRGGTHDIVTSVGTTTVRFWAPSTAPPQARKIALLVATGRVVRGQAGVACLDSGPCPPVVYGDCPPGSACPPGSPCPPGSTCCAPSVCSILPDVITLGTIGAAAGALVVGLQNNDDLKELAREVDNLPQSP